MDDDAMDNPSSAYGDPNARDVVPYPEHAIPYTNDGFIMINPDLTSSALLLESSDVISRSWLWSPLYGKHRTFEMALLCSNDSARGSFQHRHGPKAYAQAVLDIVLCLDSTNKELQELFQLEDLAGATWVQDCLRENFPSHTISPSIRDIIYEDETAYHNPIALAEAAQGDRDFQPHPSDTEDSDSEGEDGDDTSSVPAGLPMPDPDQKVASTASTAKTKRSTKSVIRVKQVKTVAKSAGSSGKKRKRSNLIYFDKDEQRVTDVNDPDIPEPDWAALDPATVADLKKYRKLGLRKSYGDSTLRVPQFSTLKDEIFTQFSDRGLQVNASFRNYSAKQLGMARREYKYLHGRSIGNIEYQEDPHAKNKKGHVRQRMSSNVQQPRSERGKFDNHRPLNALDPLQDVNVTPEYLDEQMRKFVLQYKERALHPTESGVVKRMGKVKKQISEDAEKVFKLHDQQMEEQDAQIVHLNRQNKLIADDNERLRDLLLGQKLDPGPSPKLPTEPEMRTPKQSCFNAKRLIKKGLRIVKVGGILTIERIPEGSAAKTEYVYAAT